MMVNERRTILGGLIGHCVSPQPWREIDAHANWNQSSKRSLNKLRLGIKSLLSPTDQSTYVRGCPFIWKK